MIFSISGLQASVFSYVSEFHTKEKAPRAASFASMFMPMIFIYSSIVGLLVIPMNWSVDLFFLKFVPWRLFIIAISFVNAFNTLAFTFLPESPKFLLAMNKPDEALNVLRTMYQTNTGYLKEVRLMFYRLFWIAFNSWGEISSERQAMTRKRPINPLRDCPKFSLTLSYASVLYSWLSHFSTLFECCAQGGLLVCNQDWGQCEQRRN